MIDYSLARPNESKLLDYFDEICPDWEEIAKSLLGWMSDDEVREWAEREEYYNFEEEEEVKIRYFVCGLGYDANDCITDYEREFGDFDTLEEAQDKFDEVVREAEDNLDEFFLEDEPITYWKIQLEEYECTNDYDECIDVIDEADIYKEDN